MLPATIPAIAAAGPKAELDRDRVRLLDRDSGDAAGDGTVALALLTSSEMGVPGSESSLERDPLRDLGSSSSGC